LKLGLRFYLDTGIINWNSITKWQT